MPKVQLNKQINSYQTDLCSL